MQGSHGTGWAALMSGPWHPPCSGCPAAAHAWDSCSIPAQHSMLSPLPHVPTALGTAWHWARCAGHWHRCVMSVQHQTQTRVWHLAQLHTRASARAGCCQPWHGRCPVPGHTPMAQSCQPVQPGFFRQQQICTTLVPTVMLLQCPPRHCPGAHRDAAVPVMTLPQCPHGRAWLAADRGSALPPARANHTNWHRG